MNNICLMFVLCSTISNFVFATPLEVELLNERNGYVSAKLSQSESNEVKFYLSCFSDEQAADSGSIISSVQCVYKSNTQKMKIQSLENKLEIKKNNKGEYQILSTGAFSSSSKTLHLSLHHLIYSQKTEENKASSSTVVETVVILSMDPDERLISYLSQNPVFNEENDLFEIVKKYGASVLTINKYQIPGSERTLMDRPKRYATVSVVETKNGTSLIIISHPSVEEQGHASIVTLKNSVADSVPFGLLTMLSLADPSGTSPDTTVMIYELMEDKASLKLKRENFNNEGFILLGPCFKSENIFEEKQ